MILYIHYGEGRDRIVTPLQIRMQKVFVGDPENLFLIPQQLYKHYLTAVLFFPSHIYKNVRVITTERAIGVEKGKINIALVKGTDP